MHRGEIEMDYGKVTENEIEEVLAKTSGLIEEGLTLIGRQVSFGNLRVDLLFRDRFGENLIVEVKRGTIKREHIGQIMEYSGSLPDQKPVRLMLIGNRVPSAFRKSLDYHGIEWKEIRPEQIKPFLKPEVYKKPVYPLDVGELFQKFGEMSSFSPGEKLWFESTEQWHILRKQAKKKYSKILDPQNIHAMTKEDFKSFLYFKNNLAWTNLYRRGLEAAERIDDLRKAIVFLQDETINIQERINSVLRGSHHVRGMGKNIATAILHTWDKQDRYGVWNNVTEKALKELGYLPRRVWNYGLFYSKLNEKLIELRNELKTDLVIVDSFLWFIVNRTKLLGIPSYEVKKEEKYKEKTRRKATPNEILSNLENSLRKFIEIKLTEIAGESWWKSRVPADIRNICSKRKWNREKTRPWEEAQEWPLIYYADFLDYMKIILRRDNWKEIFRKYFTEEYFVESRFRDLNPIRTDLAHNRPLTEKQIQVLENYSKEILRCIHRLS